MAAAAPCYYEVTGKGRDQMEEHDMKLYDINSVVMHAIDQTAGAGRPTSKEEITRTYQSLMRLARQHARHVDGGIRDWYDTERYNEATRYHNDLTPLLNDLCAQGLVQRTPRLPPRDVLGIREAKHKRWERAEQAGILMAKAPTDRWDHQSADDISDLLS